MRIGHGYDVHKLVEGRPLILGGVEIPHSKGLLAHSDGDVLTHAIMDSLLGAAGKRDIGYYFPDTDEKYKNADSLELLKEVVEMIKPSEIVNIDSTIIAQEPKLAPYIPQMISKLEEIVGEGKISVKATTTEKLGFIGREEGVAAVTVCLIQKTNQ